MLVIASASGVPCWRSIGAKAYCEDELRFGETAVHNSAQQFHPSDFQALDILLSIYGLPATWECQAGSANRVELLPQRSSGKFVEECHSPLRS